MDGSLWPDSLFTEEAILAPIQIMRQQAEFLSKGMNREILGNVRSHIEIDDYRRQEEVENVENIFELIVPGLGGYTLILFSATHSPQRLYPVHISSPHLSTNNDIGFMGSAEGEEDLRKQLGILFKSREIVGIIQTLKAQVANPEARPPKRPERSVADYSRRQPSVSPPDPSDEDVPF